MKRPLRHFNYLPTINIPMMLRLIGLLLLIESVFLLIPLGTTLWYGEREWTSFLFTFLISAACGASMAFLIHPRFASPQSEVTRLGWDYFHANEQESATKR